MCPLCLANKGSLLELLHVGPWTGDWFDLDTSKLNNQLFSSHLASRPNRHISNSRHDTLMMMLMVAMLASSLNELLRVVFLLIAFAGRNRTFPMTFVCPYFLNFLLVITYYCYYSLQSTNSPQIGSFSSAPPINYRWGRQGTACEVKCHVIQRALPMVKGWEGRPLSIRGNECKFLGKSAPIPRKRISSLSLRLIDR